MLEPDSRAFCLEKQLLSAGMKADAGNLESLVLAGELAEPAKSHPN